MPDLLRIQPRLAKMNKTGTLLIALMIASTHMTQVRAASEDQVLVETTSTVTLTPEQSAAVDAAVRVIKQSPGFATPPIVRRDAQREQLTKQLAAAIGGGDMMQIERALAKNLILAAKARHPDVSQETWGAVERQVNEDIDTLYKTNLLSYLLVVTDDKIRASRVSNEELRKLIFLYQHEPVLAKFEIATRADPGNSTIALLEGNAKVVSKLVSDGLVLNNVESRPAVSSSTPDTPVSSSITK
ncbi:hypothetical protein LFL96_19775 [Paraburkholderia sp. D15]|uniref:hypothetical protein n=1 Tax=Paraburkholderia sp. D15 TaxID=2880218 RepID=UPI0024787F14|nr:hypothetical protein [Paraburkholderia sp. D15]WGS53316.1 hypothetical protein LFL96_19775 [Paraburkholderia sp. D15]